ncbi:MAG: Na/Pi symporter [Burkholderiaceae bacterium]
MRRILEQAVRTRLRALLSGFVLTAAVQSSAAVTVVAIGFVSAGLLSLGQIVWVLFGANVGTTMTGWLVVLIGLDFKFEWLALPLIGAGMLMHLGNGESRRAHIGLALAGFGVLFLGIEMLRSAFGALPAQWVFPAADGPMGLVLLVLVGVVLTVLMQSSSAATAVLLTAVQGGVLGLEAAAAVVIGANVGTTATAVLAAIDATADARRAAAAHVCFNVFAAIVALFALPWLPQWADALAKGLGYLPEPPLLIALFHTAFNLVGVVLMWPVAGRLIRWLERRFRTRAEDEARPRFLDAASGGVPEVGVEALSREAARFGQLVTGAAADQLDAAAPPDAPWQARLRLLSGLDAAIDAYVVQLNRGSMSADAATRLAAVLRQMAYFSEIKEMLPRIAAIPHHMQLHPLVERLGVRRLRQDAAGLFRQLDPGQVAGSLDDLAATVARWDREYRTVKAALIEAGALGTLTPSEMEAFVRSNSALRRAVQQALKARAMLAPARQADADAAVAPPPAGERA